MALALVFVELIDIDEDASLLHCSKLVVDGGAKDEHRGREVHVGIDKWGNVAAAVAHLGVEKIRKLERRRDELIPQGGILPIIDKVDKNNRKCHINL